MKPTTEMTTAELITEYNALTGKGVKRFSSRGAGEKQVNAARERSTARDRAIAGAVAATGTVPPKSAPKAKKAKPRKVRGSASAEKTGRPASSFTVKLTASKASSKPNSMSARRLLINWLEGLTNQSATIDRIDEKFGRNMRGVVNKLAAMGWVSKVAAAA